MQHSYITGGEKYAIHIPQLHMQQWDADPVP